MKGANIGNASFGVGVCAERSVIISARMNDMALEIIRAVAVTSDVADVVSPYGICR